MKRSRLWIALAGWVLVFLTLGGWSLASPVGSSPDDDFHLASVWCGQGERAGICEAGSEENSRLVPEKAITAICYALNPEVTAACQGDEFHDAGFTLVETDRVNSGSQYPSGFYYVMSFFAGDNMAISVLLMRLFNATLFATLIIGTAVLLPKNLRFTLLGSVALTFVPLGLFTVASVNPSSWALLSNAVLFPALLGFFSTAGKQRWAMGAISAFALVLSVSSRGDSAAFSIVAVLAAGVLSFQPRKQFWFAALFAFILMAVAAYSFLSAGQTSLAVNGDMGGDPEVNPTSPAALTLLNLLALPALWAGIFGDGWHLGWLDTPIPALASGTLVFLAAGVLFSALRHIDWRKALALTGVGLAAIVFPVFVLVQSGSVVGANVQPRYILPLITLFFAVALAPSIGSNKTFRASQPVLSRTQLILVACGIAGAHALALFYNLKRNVTAGSFNLDAAAEWWWNAGPSPFTVLALATITATLALALFAYVSDRDLSLEVTADCPAEPAAEPAETTAGSSQRSTI